MSELTITYGLKAPFGGDFSNQYAPRPEASLSITLTVDDKTENFEEVADQLFDTVKMHVTAQLGVPLEKIDGSLQPVFMLNDNPPASKPSYNKAPAVKEDLPTVNIGGVDYIDYRDSEAKKNKPKHPDFKNNAGDAKWLYGQDGAPTDFYSAAEKAGVL